MSSADGNLSPDLGRYIGEMDGIDWLTGHFLGVIFL